MTFFYTTTDLPSWTLTSEPVPTWTLTDDPNDKYQKPIPDDAPPPGDEPTAEELEDGADDAAEDDAA